jgi:hypothetical protein
MPGTQYYDPNAQTAYAQASYNQGSQGGYAMPEKTPAATNVQMPYYAAEGGASGPTSPVPVYSPAPSMSPANTPANPPPNVNELPAQRM